MFPLSKRFDSLCGSSYQLQGAQSAEVEIETCDRLNTDAEGRSLPTLVRLYQLNDLSLFQTAEFMDIWQSAKETLGATLLTVKELTTYLGQVVVEHFERDEQAGYLVGAGILRNPMGSTWRTVSELPLPGRERRAGLGRSAPAHVPRGLSHRIARQLRSVA